MSVELIVDNRFPRFALALCELQVERDDRHRGRDQLQHDRRHHVGQGEDAQHQEVEGEEHVDVLLAKDVEDHVKAEEGAGGDEGKHHGVLLRHRLGSLPSLFVVILLLLLRVNTPEAAKQELIYGAETLSDPTCQGRWE